MAKVIHKKNPSTGELEILQILWKEGSCSVRQVYDVLYKRKGVCYTTVLKIMQIMHDKGLVKRTKHKNSHIYTAAEKQEATQKSLTKNFLNTAFGGAADQLVLQAISAKKLTKNEVSEIKAAVSKLK